LKFTKGDLIMPKTKPDPAADATAETPASIDETKPASDETKQPVDETKPASDETKTDESNPDDMTDDGVEGANAGSSAGLEPVLLTIKVEHVATPHGIELRRNGGDHVIDARTQDFASTQAIGAKTIENILRECGVDLPTGEDQLVISISPVNGDVIAVAAASPAE
jgi:hypothetical protein